MKIMLDRTQFLFLMKIMLDRTHFSVVYLFNDRVHIRYKNKYIKYAIVNIIS